jgi:hypothetical protein
VASCHAGEFARLAGRIHGWTGRRVNRAVRGPSRGLPG